MLLVYLAAAWSAGIATAFVFSLPPELWGVWLGLPLGSLLIWRNDPLLRRVHLCLLFLLLGALRYTLAQPLLDSNSLASLNDRGTVVVMGQVSDPPEVRDRTTNVHVDVTRVQVDGTWRDLSGRALVQVPRETDVRYGDLVRIYGAPTTPPEDTDFSYKDYLARQGIHSLIQFGALTIQARDQGNWFYTRLYAFRDRALAAIYATLPDPAASLLAGILLGVDSGIPRDVSDAFSATNTAHIIAISGFNIAIIAGILSKLSERTIAPRSRGLAACFVLFGLAAYSLMVGATASVIRAAIMGSMSVAARYLNRQNEALHALSTAALLMLVHDPFVLFDLGFQLSFLATLGMILYVNPLSTWFEGMLTHFVANERAKAIVGLLNDSFIVTLAAQITSTPLIVYTFHRLSLVGLLTNFLILPAQPAVEVFGGLATLAALIALPLGQMVGWVAWAFLEFTIAVVQWTATLPLASIPIGKFDAPLLVAYYVVLFGATRVDWRGLLSRVTLRPAIALGVALVAGMWMWSFALTAPDGKTHVQFIDAGSAATLVRTPSGHRILIDGGANPSAVNSAVGEGMPFWERSLDLIVLTNTDDAHLAGLIDILDRYSVRQIIQPAAPAKPTAAYLKWRDLVAQKNVASLQAQAGLIVSLDRDVTLEILYPSEDAPLARPAMAELRAGNIAFLFADSADADDQSAWLSSPVASSGVLVAPRQVSPEFVDAVSPQFAVLFTGTGTREKPTAELMSALGSATILRTDERGDIEFVVDGQRLAVRPAK